MIVFIIIISMISKTSLAILSLATLGSAHLCGEMKSHESFKYGRFTTSMASPMKKGSVTAFYMWFEPSRKAHWNWQEIDVEIVPSINDVF